MENAVTPKLFRINTGSCNGCDVEFVATVFVGKYKVDTLGLELTQTAQEANMLLVTGPLTAKSESFLLDTLSNISKPFVVLSTGTCSVSGGIFRDSYAIYGPLDKHVTVDVNIAGCPPRPQAIAEGIAQGISILQRKVGGEENPSVLDTIFTDFVAPESFRGKITLNEKLCTGCRTCETVCPANAIRVTENAEGFTHTVWHSTCCYCGNCGYYCPTGAISNTNDFGTIHAQEDKFKHTHVARIKFNRCERCDKKYIRASSSLIEKSFTDSTESTDEIRSVCPECRKELTFERLYV